VAWFPGQRAGYFRPHKALIAFREPRLAFGNCPCIAAELDKQNVGDAGALASLCRVIIHRPSSAPIRHYIAVY
jgi:hypothetical protein